MKILSVLLLFSLSLAYGADNWPCFRGPLQNSISTEKNWSAKSLKEDSKPLWSVNVGAGYSAVSIQDNKLYTMGNSNNFDIVFCFDATTGKQLWHYKYASKKGSYAGPRATPTISAGKCYTLGQNGTVLSLDAKTGKLIWKKNLVKDLGLKNIKWGFSGSVVVYKDSLLINAGQHGIALKASNGSKKWLSKNEKCGYATVLIAKIDKKDQAIVFGSDMVYGVDPDNGKLLWQYAWKTSWDVNAADPIAFGKNIFITSGYKKGCALLSIDGDKVSNIWQNTEMVSQFSTPVYLAGNIYGSSGNVGKGAFKCVDAMTGKAKWSHDTGFSSPLVVDDKIILLNEKGLLMIIKATPKKYALISSNQLLNDKSAKCWTMPVFCNGKLYCRNSKGMLICMNLKK